MRAPSPGVVFVLGLLALAAVAALDLATVGEASRTGYDWGGLELGDERAVYARSVYARPGDRVVVRPELTLVPGPFSAVEFVIAPGGARTALLAGEPVDAYVRLPDPDVHGCCSLGVLAWDRPGERVDRAFRDRSTAIDDPTRLDLVWVLTYAPGFTPPPEGRERTRLASQIEAEIGAYAPPRHLPTVFAGAAVAAQPAFYAAIAACALVAAGGAVAWVRRLHADAPAVDATGTEGLLRLYDTVGAYLASLRDLLVASLVVVALVGVHAAIAASPPGFLASTRTAAIALGWRNVALASVVLLYASVFGAWCVTALHAHRALARWRRRAAAPPEV